MEMMERRTFLRRATQGGLGLAVLGGLAGAATVGIGRGLLGWGDSRPAWHMPLAPPILAAHRGGAQVFPEHTFAAYLGSYEQFGIRFLELDVRASRDGVPVLIHDATVDRTTNGTGAVSELTLDALQRLDAGYRFRGPNNERWAGRGLRIPTLRDVLHRLPECVFSLEVKQAEPPCEAGVVQAVREAGMEGRVVIGSPRHALYQRIRAAAPELATFFSFRSGIRFWVASAMGLGAHFQPQHNVLMMPERLRGLELVTPQLLADARGLQIPVLVWTVNDTASMNRLLDLGVDGIVTDRPDLLADVARARAEASAAPVQAVGC